VESIEYYEYEPRNPASINTTSEITIDINNQYQFLPSKYYLLVEGQLKLADGNDYSNNNNAPVALTMELCFYSMK